MKINTEWHTKNKIAQSANLDQRVKWHLEHTRHCSCRSVPEDILEEMKKQYMGTHQEFWIFFTKNDHKALAIWAAECAEHVLPFFEKKYPADNRPWDAIRVLHEWIKTGEFKMPIIRGASLAAHAAARSVKKEDQDALFAARAAGQAVATAHVPTHALGPALYSIKAVAAAHPDDVSRAISRERQWQFHRLPKNLLEWVRIQLQKKHNLLPKELKEAEIKDSKKLDKK